jgi:hypothetical protein
MSENLQNSYHPKISFTHTIFISKSKLNLKVNRNQIPHDFGVKVDDF